MASNGPSSPPPNAAFPSSSTLPNSNTPAQILADRRLSIESERSSASSPPSLNGIATMNGQGKYADGGEGNLDPVERLQRELEKTKEEKEDLASQYRNLLAKLTTMRTTLGNKLKQDAEELDRREQLVQQLTVQNDDLSSTIITLQSELLASNSEAERASNELDSLRTRAFHETSQEERELRETQSELERTRVARDEWEQIAERERISADEGRAIVEVLKRDLELEREARVREADELEAEREKASNLQSVLEDFQAAKDHELRQAVKDHETQLNQATQSLAEYKHRALTAEVKLDESQHDTSRTQELEKEVKEKNLLIGKLRHEGVIMNEHLMEALRRLRRSSTETNVDRRLVTNVLLQFLTTDRSDPKRFEMLGLLGTILSWTEGEKEKAGLQRAHGHLVGQTTGSGSGAGGLVSFFGRSSTSLPNVKTAELEKTDETESFSRLWVEFLLTEANSNEIISPTRSNASLPGSPTRNSGSHSPTNAGPPKGGRRLVSFTASSPSLPLSPSVSRKGKERALDS